MLELHLTDIHFPYHEPKAWEIVLRVAKAESPDIVWLGGDIVDFYQVSSFSKDPQRRLELQQDLDVAIHELGRLRKVCPRARIYYHEGNHEWRLQKFLWDKASELSGLRGLKLSQLLDFRQLDIIHVSRGESRKIGELTHQHGDEQIKGGKDVARRVVEKTPANYIFGHHHKLGMGYFRLRSGKVYGAWSNGCLCTLTPEYLDFPQWQQSFALIDYTNEGTFHVDLIPFFLFHKHLSCYIHRRLYSL